MSQSSVSQLVLKFLQDHRLTTVSTINSLTGCPQSALVYYICDPSGDIYFAASSDSEKVANLKQNPKIGVMVGEEVEPIVLQIEGTGQFVTDAESKISLLARISTVANANKNLFSMPPLVKLLQDHNLTIVRIMIESFKYSDFSQPNLYILEGTHQDFV